MHCPACMASAVLGLALFPFCHPLENISRTDPNATLQCIWTPNFQDLVGSPKIKPEWKLCAQDVLEWDSAGTISMFGVGVLRVSKTGSHLLEIEWALSSIQHPQY